MYRRWAMKHSHVSCSADLSRSLPQPAVLKVFPSLTEPLVWADELSTTGGLFHDLMHNHCIISHKALIMFPLHESAVKVILLVLIPALTGNIIRNEQSLITSQVPVTSLSVKISHWKRLPIQRNTQSWAEQANYWTIHTILYDTEKWISKDVNSNKLCNATECN